MCVIMMFEDSYPTLDMLKNAESTNPHGGGMSWINSDGLVEWIKGHDMKPKRVMSMIKKQKIKLPIIIHYRIATHGGINDMLCHPFPLGIEAKNAEHGTTNDGVLFHNGIWDEYNEYALKLCLNRNIRLPDGDMSDSSIMAWVASHIGKNFLEFTDEKVTVMTPKGILKYGDGWTTVDNITCSNDNFEPTTFWGSGEGYQYKVAKKADDEVDGSKSDDTKSKSIEFCDNYDDYYDDYLAQQKMWGTKQYTGKRYENKDDEDNTMTQYNNCDMEKLDK